MPNQEETGRERKIDEFEMTVEELIRVIDVATQSFVDSGKFERRQAPTSLEFSMYRFADTNVNPDASNIFAVHLQMHRLDSHPDISR